MCLCGCLFLLRKLSINISIHRCFHCHCHSLPCITTAYKTERNNTSLDVKSASLTPALNTISLLLLTLLQYCCSSLLRSLIRLGEELVIYRPLLLLFPRLAYSVGMGLMSCKSSPFQYFDHTNINDHTKDAFSPPDFTLNLCSSAPI